MTEITLSWNKFKSATISTSIRYVDIYDNYYLYATVDTFNFVCVISKTENEDQIDFETNYKNSSISLT